MVLAPLTTVGLKCFSKSITSYIVAASGFDLFGVFCSKLNFPFRILSSVEKRPLISSWRFINLSMNFRMAIDDFSGVCRVDMNSLLVNARALCFVPFLDLKKILSRALNSNSISVEMFTDGLEKNWDSRGSANLKDL
ncbi:hypothetical protein WICPIJ_005235 [Wickerhamomyces pijperi]|uniref:Uncharacterized protein n=1 Tax=Wickerhamomyces pijperi TaxID=599730 RepID=A0A9P8TLA9_WICPI|nr:hypothetical protein WICPIJ_005235 [Wickerhamomyces pijperi]